MQTSQRIAAIKGNGSDGWEIYYRTRALLAAGTRVLNLTIGEHDTRTDKRILDAMHASAVAGNTGYAFGPGKMELRTAVADRVQTRTGVPTTWENVVITPGGQSGLRRERLPARRAPRAARPSPCWRCAHGRPRSPRPP